MKYKILYNGKIKELEVTGFKETIEGFISFYHGMQPLLVVPKDSLVYIELLDTELLDEPQKGEL